MTIDPIPPSASDASWWLRRINPQPRIVGSSYCPGDWLEPWRSIYDHQLVLFREGSGELEIGDKVFACPPDSYIIIPPATPHSSNMTSPRGGYRHWIHFDWIEQNSTESLPIMTQDLTPEQYARCHLPPGWISQEVRHGKIGRKNRVFDLHERLEMRWEKGGDHNRLLCRPLLLELFLELLDESDDDGGERIAEDQLANNIREHLRKLAYLPMGKCPLLRQNLPEFGFSYEHICRLFKRKYGTTPLAYMQNVRIERAKTLLRDTDLPVQEVAYRAGYESPAYFTRIFARESKESPRAYRTRYR